MRPLSFLEHCAKTARSEQPHRFATGFRRGVATGAPLQLWGLLWQTSATAAVSSSPSRTVPTWTGSSASTSTKRAARTSSDCAPRVSTAKAVQLDEHRHVRIRNKGHKTQSATFDAQQEADAFVLQITAERKRGLFGDYTASLKVHRALLSKHNSDDRREPTGVVPIPSSQILH